MDKIKICKKCKTDRFLTNLQFSDSTVLHFLQIFILSITIYIYILLFKPKFCIKEKNEYTYLLILYNIIRLIDAIAM